MYHTFYKYFVFSNIYIYIYIFLVLAVVNNFLKFNTYVGKYLLPYLFIVFFAIF